MNYYDCDWHGGHHWSEGRAVDGCDDLCHQEPAVHLLPCAGVQHVLVDCSHIGHVLSSRWLQLTTTSCVYEPAL